MVYCAYCGKGFTRKEHLERHIPSHTNVKPHRCTACQLSFARRDLLQRHYTTYHEARDPTEPLPGGPPTVAGRTPIACQNCANAKTGCDKRVPCGRCTEKNLPCEARYARRSSKAAVRAAQATAAFHSALTPSPEQTPPTAVANINPLDANQPGVKPEGNSSPTAIEVVIPGFGLAEGCSKQASPYHLQVSPGELSSPHNQMEGGLDDFMHITNDYAPQGATYHDLMLWPEFSMNIEVYPSNVELGRPDISMSAFPDLGDVSPPSEPLTASSSSRSSIRTPGTSTMSLADLDNGLKPMELSVTSPTDNSIPEFEVVIAAEGAWNLARCNPPPSITGTCPRTAIVHLECLEQKSKQEGTWSSLEKYLEQVDWDASDLASVVPLTSRTRDKMVAITQSFLHKALEIHRGGSSYPKSGYATPGDFNFIVLPSAKILEYFLRSYVRSLSMYYPLVTAGCLDPNEMLQNNQASTLLVLLMIAQGAAAMPMAEARYLAAGLAETCRISLFDIVEKDVGLSADPIALRAALLFIVLGVWSGDKWLMDIAMGQRGMYMSMLKHAGMFDPQPCMVPSFNDASSTELEWRAWVQRETRNRLVYNYVMLDQELSLFYDTAPLFAITELRCPLPGPEMLWMSSESEQWFSAMQSVYGCTANVNPQLLSTPSATPSLYDLFQDFLHDNLSRGQRNLSPQQLRLVLHPLQALLYHLRQMLSCFSDTPGPRRTGARSVTKSSTLHRLEEVQDLLQRWYDLSANHAKANPDCPVTRCNLVLYHLICLNAVTDFAEIERFARREAFDHWYWDISQLKNRCIFQRGEAVFHCGQVFRLLRLMPNDRRPAWWTVAMYRATLILWVDSVSRVYSGSHTNKRDDSGAAPQSAPVIIDQATPEDASINAYVWNSTGVAMLTRTDGTMVTLDKPAGILSYAIQSLEAGFSSRIGDGIKRKLIALGNNWNVEAMTAFPSGSSGN